MQWPEEVEVILALEFYARVVVRPLPKPVKLFYIGAGTGRQRIPAPDIVSFKINFPHNYERMAVNGIEVTNPANQGYEPGDIVEFYTPIPRGGYENSVDFSSVLADLCALKVAKNLIFVNPPEFQMSVKNLKEALSKSEYQYRETAVVTYGANENIEGRKIITEDVALLNLMQSLEKQEVYQIVKLESPVVGKGLITVNAIYHGTEEGVFTRFLGSVEIEHGNREVRFYDTIKDMGISVSRHGFIVDNCFKRLVYFDFGAVIPTATPEFVANTRNLEGPSLDKKINIPIDFGVHTLRSLKRFTDFDISDFSEISDTFPATKKRSSNKISMGVENFDVDAYVLNTGVSKLDDVTEAPRAGVTYQKHLKFEIKYSTENPELLDSVSIQRAVRARYPWLYDITVNRGEFTRNTVIASNSFNSLFIYVGKCVEKTKGFGKRKVTGNANTSLFEIDYFLGNRKVKGDLGINHLSGVFTLDPYPDGTKTTNVHRAWFSDKFGVFQAVNGKANPRLSGTPKLLWVDLSMNHSRDDMRDIFGVVNIPQREELRVVLFSKEIIDDSDLIHDFKVVTPFIGSAFGDGESLFQDAMANSETNYSLFLEPLNHYFFKCSFKDPSSLYPTYTLNYDHAVKEDGVPLIDLEVSHVLDKLRIKISKKVKPFHLTLWNSRIFGAELQAQIAFDRHGVPVSEQKDYVVYELDIKPALLFAGRGFEIQGILKAPREEVSNVV